MRRIHTLCFALVGAIAACSSSDPPAAAPPVTVPVPATFSAYCVGTLQSEQKVMHSAGAGAWQRSGDKVPATTKFVLEAQSIWAGYAFAADGSPLRIDIDPSKGLVSGVDFVSDCQTAMQPFAGDVKGVVLAKATFHPNADLSGAACTLDAGTTFTNYSVTGEGSTTTEKAQSDELKAKCGLDAGYTNDLQLGRLVPIDAAKK